MRTSREGIELIKRFEGCVLSAYRCPAGVWSIGYGHTSGVKEGMKITKAQAQQFLEADLSVYENYVNQYVNFPLRQRQFDALVSFCYNCGCASLKTLVRGRNAFEVADALLLYNKAGSKTLQGLVRRRKAERELFLKGLLPLKVVSTCDLNVREGAGVQFRRIRTAKKGESFMVWAITNVNGVRWGRCGREFFCLAYCTQA